MKSPIKNHLVAQILQLAHLVQHHGVADMDVGAVGSRPNLMRSGWPDASERVSFLTHSSLGSSSSTPRSEISSACPTPSETGVL